MSNLTVWKAMDNVSSTVSNIVTLFRSARIVRKEDSLRLKAQLAALERAARARGLGEVARANIEEIRKTQDYIDQCGFKGTSLDYAMDNLSDLSIMLRQNLREYMNEN